MVSASVSLRCASLKDAGDMTRLSQQLGYRVTLPEMQQRLGNLLQREEHLVEVATRGGSDRAVGWVHACRTDSFLIPPFAEIKVLVVEEGYRRCGIGSLLLQTVEARSRRLRTQLTDNI